MMKIYPICGVKVKDKYFIILSYTYGVGYNKWVNGRAKKKYLHMYGTFQSSYETQLWKNCIL
jgi:hypothetical protein